MAEDAAICAILICAEFASESWLTAAKYPELKKAAGKTNKNMTDPISDMLTRIRNAQAVGRDTVIVPSSKIKLSIAEILAKEGFIKSINKQGRGIDKTIEINLLYEDKKHDMPRIKELRRISKPGKREYIKAKDVRSVLGGRGILVISTSKGLMVGMEAKKKKLGGEVLCEIW